MRIDREKERAQLKEQNRRLRIQLRDTAEAVHAAGELLVRLREAEEASTLEKVSPNFNAIILLCNAVYEIRYTQLYGI